ncbi:MAG: hypothetical protein WAM73_04695 [Desulfobacterales bacterium]
MVPLSIGAKIVGALSFGHLREESGWPEKIVKRLQLLVQVFAHALARKAAEDTRFRIKKLDI